MVSESQEPAPFTSGDRVIDAFGKKFTVKLCQLRTDWSKIRWVVETTCGCTRYASDLRLAEHDIRKPDIQPQPIGFNFIERYMATPGDGGRVFMATHPQGTYVLYLDHCKYVDETVQKMDGSHRRAMLKLIDGNTDLQHRIKTMQQRFLRFKTSNAELQDQVRRAEAEVVKVKAKDPCVPLTRIADALDRVVQIRHVSGGKR